MAKTITISNNFFANHDSILKQLVFLKQSNQNLYQNKNI